MAITRSIKKDTKDKTLNIEIDEVKDTKSSTKKQKKQASPHALSKLEKGLVTTTSIVVFGGICFCTIMIVLLTGLAV